eukprot:CAMPEP_0185854472 /NCGR_PEP_ID=MMETSP1354-20130828/22488_1 /TAXON_ID=708628 /ORGANISM="Erythrolobus madagascarensis, Strain CCMP3276" /LENGTH=40 /DNA_ID= /DNA_START= /DNA_END= /DNA_ORIENTATION=
MSATHEAAPHHTARRAAVAVVAEEVDRELELRLAAFFAAV